MKSLSINNLSELPQVAKQILFFSNDKKIFCFYGELGAGKTTLIKAVCKQLGATDAVSSPTFSLINEYHTDKGEKIFHLDLYRLKNESEIYDIGYEEYLFSGNYCFIEWADKMERLLPDNCIRVKIEVKESKRIISIF